MTTIFIINASTRRDFYYLKTGTEIMDIEQLIKINREDERKSLADRSAARMRMLSAYVRANRLDAVVVSELLDGEAEKIEREAQELEYV
ncbi:DUF2732 family protein [Xenorhabdus nematophila]|uniref:DUF2732 family protein n=1 Tax=Xenorhabdus nematophila TaxID=628 RepID=UPI0032B857ED